MKRLALLSMLGVLGCRSSIDLSPGRAYECSRDAGLTGCTSGWLCGDDLRCYDPDAGVARKCETAQTGCGGGWKCGFDKVCFDPAVLDGPVRGCSDPALHCPAGWHCGFDNTCFDPARVDGPRRACADPSLHCPTGFRCGLDRLCFDPAAGTADGGARACTDPALHCGAGEGCGLDGVCFETVRPSDGGVGASCELDRHCPADWRCGVESNGRRRCQAIGVGGPYPCANDQDCEAQWRCNPVSRTCVEVRDALEARPFSTMEFTLLGPLDAGGPVKAVSVSPAGDALIPALTNDPSRFLTVASLPRAGNLSLEHWAEQEPRTPDGGIIVAVRQLFPFDSSEARTIAALPAEALVLTDAGTVLRFRYRGVAGERAADQVVMLRPSLDDPSVLALRSGGPSLEVLRWGKDFDAGVRVNTMPASPCGVGTGNLVDLAWASEQGTLRMIVLTTSGFCFGVLPPGQPFRASASWSTPPGATPRRVLTNFHEGPGAFIERPPGSPLRESGITSFVVEFALADGGTGLISSLLNDWTDQGLPTLSHIMGSQLPAPCDNACPGNVPPTEVLPVAPPRGREDRTFFARCPSVTSAALNDGGTVPEGSYLVSVSGNDCPNWRRSRVFSAEEERPRQGPVVTDRTSANRRSLMDDHGRLWVPSSDAGLVPRALQLDRTIDLAIRVFFEGQQPRLFLSAGKQQFAALPALGVYAQRDFPDDFTPTGSISGAPTWVITTGGVFDSARFPPGSELPFIVAAPSTGTVFRLPSSGVERNDLLFIASQDSISVADVRAQKLSTFTRPATLARAIIPTPGRDVRSLTATPTVDGGAPQLWSVTQGGVFRSTSSTGTNWITQQVPLAGRDGEGTLVWSVGEQVRLLMESGEVISLPTAVPLSATASRGRVSSAARFCGATWAIVDQGNGDGGLYTLGSTPGDGGLAGWINLTPSVPMRQLSSSVLSPSSSELVITSPAGEAWLIRPAVDGGCLTVRD